MKKIMFFVCLVFILLFNGIANSQPTILKQQDEIMSRALGESYSTPPEIPNWEVYNFWFACFTAESTSSTYPFETSIVAGCNGNVKWVDFRPMDAKKWRNFVKSIEHLHKIHFGSKLNWGEFEDEMKIRKKITKQ